MWSGAQTYLDDAIYIYKAVFRVYLYKKDGVHWATIAERTLSSGGVCLPAGEQFKTLGLLRLKGRKSRHRRIKKQRRH